MGKQCQICGESSYLYYPFCKKHLEMKTNGLLLKCEDCGKWHVKGEKCSCQKEEPKYTELPTSGFTKCVVCEGPTKGYAFCKKCWNNLSQEEMLEILNKSETEKTKEIEKEEKKESELTCLICGEVSDGKHFCKNCYKKYSTKSITAIIDKCKSIDIVDEYGNRKYKTCNGLFVRSQQEKIIFDELFNRKIRIQYEKTLYLKDENGETQELHPDFFLTDYNLYIEHWGYENTNNKEYIKTKEYKMKLYQLNNKKIAGTCSKDIEDIQAAIDRIFAENDIQVT